MAWEYLCCLIMLAAAFYTDIKSMKIPNTVTLIGMASGCCYHMLMGGWDGVIFSLKGAAVGFGLMLVLYWFRAVGGGDVKLFGGIGAWLGIGLTLSTIMYSVIFAGLIGVIILIWRREMFGRLRGILQSVLGAVVLRDIALVKHKAEEQLKFPFMLAVLPGTLLAIYYF